MGKFSKFVTIIIGLSSLFAIQSSFAYYCSTQAGRGYINIGDTIDQVGKACGTPTNTQVDEVPDKSFSTTEYWSYSNVQVKQALPLGVNRPEAKVSNSGSMATFEIKNGAVTSISEGGSSVTSTDTCGSPVSVGASSNSVLSNCGTPSNTSTQNTPSDKKNKVTTWTYDRGQYSSPLILKFEDEKLTAIDG